MVVLNDLVKGRAIAAIEVVAPAQSRPLFVHGAEARGRRPIARLPARAVALEDAFREEPAQTRAELFRARPAGGRDRRQLIPAQ